MPHRALLILLAALVAAPLAGCAGPEPPPPLAGVTWIPGHTMPNGQFVHGHYRMV